jgi:hypothetical protein
VGEFGAGVCLPGDRFETFLACSVPYLTFEVLCRVGLVVLDREDAGAKLDADGDVVGRLVAVVSEPEHQV